MFFFSFFDLGELVWSLSADWLKHVIEEATVSVVYDARELGRRSRSESQPSQKAVVVTQVPTRGCACRAADVIPCYWETYTSTTTCDGDTQGGNKTTRIILHILCVFQQVQTSAHLDTLNILAQERTDDLISIIDTNSQNKSTRRQWTVNSNLIQNKYTVNYQGKKITNANPQTRS